MIKKITLIVLFVLIILFCLAFAVFVFRRDIYYSFKESKKINYCKDIECLEIFCSEDMQIIEGQKTILLYDKEDIKKIINYINSLDVVELNDFRDYNYEECYISILISSNEDTPDAEGFSFMSNYYILYNNGLGYSTTNSYFIKDFKCDEKGKNNIYYFLYDLINKDKEKYLTKSE